MERDPLLIDLSAGKGRLRLDLVLLAALLLAVAGRFNGLDWGWTDFSPLPGAEAPAMSFYDFHPDETSNVKVARNFTESDSWRPTGELYGQKLDYSLYGASTVYIHVAAVRLAGLFGDWTPWDFEDPLSKKNTYLAIRWATQLLGLACILLLYGAGLHFFDRRTARWAALLLACAAFHAQSGRFGTVDIPMVFFMVWSLYHSGRLFRFGLRRDLLLAALAAGLALSTKVNAVLVVIPLVAAELELAFRDRETSDWKDRLAHTLKQLFGARLWSAAAVTVGVFFLLNPYAFLDWENYLGGDHAFALFHIIRNVRGEFYYPFQIQFEHIQPHAFLLGNVLPWAAGHVLAWVGLAGIGFMCWKRERGDLAIAGWFLVSFLMTGSAQVLFMRYSLPFLPMLALGAARLVTGLPQHFRAPRPAGLALGVLVLLPSAFWTMALASVHNREDSRIQAGRYLKQAIPDGAVVLHERSANTIKPVIHRPRFSANPCMEITSVYRSPSASAGMQLQELEKRLEGVDWAAILESNRKLCFDRNGRYPAISGFYQALFEGQLGLAVDTVFKPLPRFLGISIDDEPAEFSLRYYDHEEIHIFRRDPAQDAAAAFERLRAKLADPADRLLARGEEALARGDLAAARQAAEEGLKTGLAESRFYGLLGRVFRRAALLDGAPNNLEFAAQYLQRAAQSEPFERGAAVAGFLDLLIDIGQAGQAASIFSQVRSQGLEGPELEAIAARLASGEGELP